MIDNLKAIIMDFIMVLSTIVFILHSKLSIKTFKKKKLSKKEIFANIGGRLSKPKLWTFIKCKSYFFYGN